MMKRIQHIVLLLATVSAAGACTTSDEPWTPDSLEGKTVSVGVIKGDEIPSELADATKVYAVSRPFDVRSFDAASLALATRADGCMPNGMPDHVLEAAELVQLEGSDRWRTLSPDEQAAMPALWKFLEVDRGFADEVTH